MIKNEKKAYVAAALIPVGNTVAKSTSRTPSGESSRQKPGNPGADPVFPTQRVVIPLEMFTFSSRVYDAIYEMALIRQKQGINDQ
jgi:hypothetical protein